MRTSRSYRQLAATVEDQAARIARAIAELDVVMERLAMDDETVAHIARARAALAGDQLHER